MADYTGSATGASLDILTGSAQGTFTPALQFGGASTGITYTSRTGVYTRIGRLMFIDIEILLSSKGTATGSATISGLPTASVGSSAGSTGTLYSIGVATSHTPLAQVETGSSVVSLVEITDTGTANALTDADFTDTSNPRVSLVYRVA